MAVTKNDPDPTLAGFIEDAARLLDQKSMLYAQLAASRTMLRAMVAAGRCSEEQYEWVQRYFPVKRRGVRRNEKASNK